MFYKTGPKADLMEVFWTKFAYSSCKLDRFTAIDIIDNGLVS